MVERSQVTADLLFELGTEELPPTALRRLSDALTREFLAGLAQADLVHGAVEAFASPRRLGLLVRDCSLRQPDRAQCNQRSALTRSSMSWTAA